ncbi:hypothetical protein [Qipengyuania sp. ASV99]|uniref:hypothetical protein n=1 Tax=Qipengyuania sp. ASV99 TaxID=3399681 RepID=UPI003A4C81DA
MSDKEIKALVVECQDTLKGYLNSVGPNVNSLSQQLEFAQHELTSRQSTRLARLSLVISTIAIAASALSFII